MAALHLDDTARRRNRGPIRQEQDSTRAFRQPSRNAGPPQQGIEFFTLFGCYRNNPLVLCHWNVLVQETPDHRLLGFEIITCSPF
jgi:hypothetical protein